MRGRAFAVAKVFTIGPGAHCLGAVQTAASSRADRQERRGAISYGRGHEAFATAAVHKVQARPLRPPVYGALFPSQIRGCGQ